MLQMHAHRLRTRGARTAAGVRGLASALQLQLPPLTLRVHHLAQRNGAPVAQLSSPLAKLMPTIALSAHSVSVSSLTEQRDARSVRARTHLRPRLLPGNVGASEGAHKLGSGELSRVQIEQLCGLC